MTPQAAPPPASSFGPRLLSGLGAVGSVVATLIGLLFLTFAIGRLMPVDPVLAIIGDEATQATYDRVYQQLGLDQPVYVQFFRYVSDILRGDFGVAILTGRPVIEDIIRVFPATVELATLSILIGAGIGVPLGVLAATRRDRIEDHAVRFITLISYSTPVFWLGLIGLIVFYAMLGWSGGTGRVEIFYTGIVPPITGFLLIDSLITGNMDVFWSALRNIWLPAAILGLSSMAYISRMTRSFMIEQLGQEYILTARIKGMSESAVIWRHAFRNIRVQLVTIVALAYGSLLEGAVLIETVFSWPGFGGYLTSNLMIGDMNAVMACVLLVGVIFIGLNLLSDVLYRVFDPRTKAQ
ncbi:peptide/nickel transport system permease protein [Devosia enhydra]|uniref:Peptide/nickel transport system permease protein n=1 Tax=Devosia enhydra TaxID=665118 RepID=A0A1K2I0D6_9HYPH|nr:ABC transporter permease [Devosia enhydra]SFZ85118.1 peptide/nickel transport system permease protein [Devosia enhydra]